MCSCDGHFEFEQTTILLQILRLYFFLQLHLVDFRYSQGLKIHHMDDRTTGQLWAIVYKLWAGEVRGRSSVVSIEPYQPMRWLAY